MKRLLMGASLLALTGIPVTAQMPSGNDLHHDCTMVPHWCSAFAAGIMSAMRQPVPQALACLPKAATSSQLSDVIADYLRDRPERHHLPVVEVVAEAILGAWPCEKGKTYGLYRNRAHDRSARIHVATFDSAEHGAVGTDFNASNCAIARDLFLSQSGVAVIYWCEEQQ